MLLRSPEKSTIGKHVLRWGNVNVIQVSPGKYFYNLQSQSSVLHGTIDLNRKRYRILPLLASSFILAFFLSVLVDKQTYEESLIV